MIEIIRIAVLMPLIVIASACSSAIDDDWEEHQKSVIRVKTEFGTGTAFSINDKGYYVTNYHVVGESGEYDVMAVESTFPAIKLHPAEVVWSTQAKDLAIIHVPSWINKPLEFLVSEKVRVNLPVLSIGFPGSNDAMAGSDNPAWTVPTLKRGIISEKMSLTVGAGGDNWAIFEHSATVNSGNSGGPLVDECGRVVGINVAKASTSVDISDALQGGAFGNSIASIDTSEGAYFAIQSLEAIAALNANQLDFISTNRACLGEKLNPKMFMVGLFSMTFMFGAFLLALFAYVKKKAPNRPFNTKTVSEIILNKVDSKENIEEDSKGPAAYRGDGGEVIVRHAKRLISTTGQPVSIDLLPGKAVRIGRDPNQCDLVFVYDFVSRSHAEVTLSLDGMEVNVVDLKSASGTYIDGSKVSDVKPGDVLLSEQKLIIGTEEVVLILSEPSK